MKPVEIPQYLDEPERIIFWDTDEFGVFLSVFAIGLAMAKIALGMIAGMLLSLCYKQFIKKNGRDAPLKFAHWYLPFIMSRCSSFHDASIRIWRG